MEQGGWFALPNLRGGNEYGEAWHKAAMFEKKQNVFDDWFGGAEYLIANRVTLRRSTLRFAGVRMAGLLMGASMTQRPGFVWRDLVRVSAAGYAAVPDVFEMGRTWTTEYGSAENAKDYPYILKYSPYQNVKMRDEGYPAIFFFTGRWRYAGRSYECSQDDTADADGELERKRPILLHYSSERRA